MNEDEIYKKALDKWGIELQMTVCIEEMSELIKEICKFQRDMETGQIKHHNDIDIRGVRIAEEIADVQIMINQIIEYFGNQYQVNTFKMDKLKKVESWLV